MNQNFLRIKIEQQLLKIKLKYVKDKVYVHNTLRRLLLILYFYFKFISNVSVYFKFMQTVYNLGGLETGNEGCDNLIFLSNYCIYIE